MLRISYHNTLAKNTLSVYRSTLRGYFKLFYPELQKHSLKTLDKELVEISLNYVKQDRDFRKDLMRFRKHISQLAPKTIATKLAVLIRHFESNEITFNTNFTRNLKGRGATEAISKEHVPDKTEIARILKYISIQAKTLTLVLASSGMRIGEAVKLRLDDLDLSHEPARINLRSEYTKTKRSRHVFISTEAKEVLAEWLEYRPRYIEKINNFIDESKAKDYSQRVFPYTASSFRILWRSAVEKAGLYETDPVTNRITIRPHNLRKFFRTYGKWKNPDVAEALMGHTSGLKAVYARFDQAEDILREGYLEAEQNLSLSQNTRTIIELREKVETQSDDIQRLVTDLSLKNVRLRDEVDELKAQVKDTFDAAMHFLDESNKIHQDAITGMRDRISGLEKVLAQYMPDEDFFELVEFNPNPCSPLEIENAEG